LKVSAPLVPGGRVAALYGARRAPHFGVKSESGGVELLDGETS
jgi:hypothetical protein